MKRLQLYWLVISCLMLSACGENSSTSESTTDSMPVVTPELTDTSRVITPPPTGDSNVINPDSTVISR